MVLRLAREREAERVRYLADLGEERDRLEEQVERRTRELTDLAGHLQRVREDERGHLARELHDELGGLLTAAKLDIARVRKRVEGTGPEVAERIRHLGQMLDAGIALKRRIIEDLRPSSLANLGLQRTLEIQCREFAARSEIRVQADIADLRLDAEHALAIYRVVQEALTNVSKYARASEVQVQLQRTGDRVILRVHDDGCGFDQRACSPAVTAWQACAFASARAAANWSCDRRPARAPRSRRRCRSRHEAARGPSSWPQKQQCPASYCRALRDAACRGTDTSHGGDVYRHRYAGRGMRGEVGRCDRSALLS